MHLLDHMDEKAKRREWRIQRALWVVLAAAVLAVAAGLVGGGPAARAHPSAQAEGIRADAWYDALNRREHVSELRLEVFAPQAEGDELRVTLSPALADAVSVRSSVPDADGGQAGPEGATYTYQVEDWSAPVRVLFEYTAERTGTTRGTITLQAGDGPSVELPFSHFIYP